MGIRRYGHAFVPLDEALSRVVLDISGRPGLDLNVDFTRARIGEFDVDLIYEFFQGFITAACHCGVVKLPASRYDFGISIPPFTFLVRGACFTTVEPIPCLIDSVKLATS